MTISAGLAFPPRASWRPARRRAKLLGWGGKAWVWWGGNEALGGAPVGPAPAPDPEDIDDDDAAGGAAWVAGMGAVAAFDVEDEEATGPEEIVVEDVGLLLLLGEVVTTAEDGWRCDCD